VASVTHAAIATGSATNWLTAGTWGDCYVGYPQVETTTTALTTSYQLNTAVQPGAMTIRGLGVRLSVRTGTTGTMTVSLYGGATSGTADVAVTTAATYLDDSRLAITAGDWVGGTITCGASTMVITSSTATRFTGASWTGGTPAAGQAWSIAGGTTGGTQVTINTSQLPVAATADLNGGWIFFKFGANVTLAAATNYQVQAKTSSASMVSLFSLATTNWSAYLRTTTSTAPVATDDFIITGEYVDTSTNTAAIVTMNNADTTDWGSTPTAANSLLTPGVAICQSGTLSFGTTATTAYQLKMSNSIVVYSGGTFNMPATAMPSDSSGILVFDCGTNVDYGLVVRNLGTFVAQGNPVTAIQTTLTASNGGYCTTNGTAVTATASQAQSFTGLTGAIVINAVGYTIASVESATTLTLTGTAGVQSTPVRWTHAGTATTITVADTTGWVSDDVVAIASTSQTASDCESATLNVVSAGSSTIDTALAKPHLGISPTIAEVIHLTRNVKIYGVDATHCGYISIGATSTVNCDYLETYNLGSATASKRGWDVTTTTGNCNVAYSSFHDFTVASSYGFNLTGGAWNNVTLSYCNFYNISNYFLQTAGTSGTTWTIDHCICIANRENTQGIVLSDSGGTFTNNTVVGCGAVTGTSEAVRLLDTLTGTLSGNTAHSNSGSGFNSNTGGSICGTISNTTIWRNGGTGFALSASGGYVVLSTITAFGNNSESFYFSGYLKLISATSNGDTLFSTGAGLRAYRSLTAVLINCDFSTVSGIKTAHSGTGDFQCSSNLIYFAITAINSKFGATTIWSGQTTSSTKSFIACQRKGTTKGNHITYKTQGNLSIDSVIFNTATPSLRMTPNTAAIVTDKLESGSFKVNVNDGQTCTPSVYVRESVVGDGYDYSGNRMRLILKQNDAIGVTADVQIGSSASVASEGAFELLTGTTAVATDDGVMEFVVDADFGTANSWVNVDDFSATVT
jgi:hypothetical protein